jgi:hypothetical protein
MTAIGVIFLIGLIILLVVILRALGINNDLLQQIKEVLVNGY